MTKSGLISWGVCFTNNLTSGGYGPWLATESRS